MLLTRWKLMAGVLGVSIGGLAAAASQCPKLDKSKGRQPDAPVTAEAPKLPPAGAPSPAPLALPGVPAPMATLPALPVVPAAPQLTPTGVTPPPPLLVPPAPTAGLPALPDFPAPTQEPKPAKPPEVPPAGSASLVPGLPDAALTPPAAKPTVPMTPPKSVAEAPKSAPVGDLVPPAPAKPTAGAPDGRGLVGTPMFTNRDGEFLPLNPVPSKAPAPGTIVPVGATQPPAATPPALPPGEPPLTIEVPPSKPTPAPAEAVKVGAVKYRILLRVGEGEPTFEVKSGDDLVLKVACEKVDIKSPDKGAGPSAVTARGKVRFAGFGVEGSCEELSFMAGTGEVSMAGDVKVQMKDKLGRVESELTTGTLKYKIDASTVGATIKP